MLNIVISLISFLSLSAGTPTRIVSLSPAHTQTLIDLGLEDRIVCAAEPLTSIRTKNKIKSVGYYHKPSIELIISCKPDLITTTYAGTPPELYRKLKKAGYNILVDNPKDLSSIKEFIMKLSNIFGLKTPYVIKKMDSICKKEGTTNTVMIIGFEPLIVVGKDSFVSDALKCAGMNNIVPGLYPRISLEKLLSYKNDTMIVAVNDPKNFKDYQIISGSFKGKTLFIDPNKILMPSTRIIEGIELLK